MCYISLGYSNITYILIYQAGEKAYLIDDQSRGNNKQSGYVYVHERAEKIVEDIVDKFCLFLSSIKAVSLQLCRGVAK